MKETHPTVLEGQHMFNRHSYPNMDYVGLYQEIIKITEVVPVVEIGVQGLEPKCDELFLYKTRSCWNYMQLGNFSSTFSFLEIFCYVNIVYHYFC